MSFCLKHNEDCSNELHASTGTKYNSRPHTEKGAETQASETSKGKGGVFGDRMNEFGVGNLRREFEFFSFHHTCEVDVEKVDVKTCLHQASDNSNGVHIPLCPVSVDPIRHV